MKRHAPCPRRVYRYTRGRRENSGGFRPSPPFEYAGLATGCREKKRERETEREKTEQCLAFSGENISLRLLLFGIMNI